MFLTAFDLKLPKVEPFSHIDRRPVSDLLILPVWEDKTLAVPVSDLEKIVSGVLATNDFEAKLGDTLLVYQGIAERRILLLGLGKPTELTSESMRQAYFQAFQAVLSKKVKEIAVAVPKASEHLYLAVLEAFYYAQYRFVEYKKEASPQASLDTVHLLVDPHSDISDLIEECEATFRSLFFVRDLVNRNADEVNPPSFVHAALQLASRFPKLTCTVLEKTQIEELGMGLFLSVAKASAYPPYLIHLSYKGNPGSSDLTLFVGKAITFDTGGLHLKVANSMDTMRCDMAGGATLLGLLPLLDHLKLGVNIDVLIPVCENAIGSSAFKPGDMIKSMKGIFVEITSTDAEGRLCLADAITYGIQNLKPSRIIDIATLTGSMEIALGTDISGFLTNSEPLAQAIDIASTQSGELFWRMPLYQGYKELLKSDQADIKSTGGRIGGAIIAALFLQEFVENHPWVHIDIAGTAYLDKARRYLGKGATGVGLKLLLEFCRRL